MEDADASIPVTDDVAVDDVRPAAAKLFNATQGEADFDVPFVVCWSAGSEVAVFFERVVSSQAACNDVAQIVLFSGDCEGCESGRVDRWNDSAATDDFGVADMRGISGAGASDGTGEATGVDANSGDDAGAVSTGVGADVAAATALTVFEETLNDAVGEMTPATASTVSVSSASNPPAPIMRRYLEVAAELVGAVV